MGMGEPLDNYDNVLRFLRLVSSEEGMNISMRHISVSTSGVVPRIYDLKKEKLGITLSVSLHAPNDEIRSRTMPINKKWNTEELLKACREYAKFTRRRVSFEYAVISGVNDSKECALLLAERLKGMLCHVNLIPVNEVKESGYKKPSTDSIRKFCDILNSKGITATVRRTLGSDINASCGQLRRSTLENKGI
jgi:23S rRNA (adenine2503-C2)-methyltransferase